MNFKDDEILNFINSEVPTYQRELIIQILESNSDSEAYYNKMGMKLTGEESQNPLLNNTGPVINKESFWNKINKEFYIFICTKDKKYTTERNLVGKNFKEIVTIISTAIASTFSIGAGVITGIITTILISMVKIHKNAWCELKKEIYP